MEHWERELHSHRIISGRTRLRLDGQTFFLVPPSREVRYTASEVYRDIWQECHLQGVLTQDELLDILRSKRIWTGHDEEQQKLLTEKIDDMKVGLYENWFRSNVRFQIRQALVKGKAELNRLDGIRHGLDHVTCDGVAASGRVRFLTAHSLLRSDSSPIFPGEEDWNRPDEVLDDAIEYLVRNRLSEQDVREICRNDPWRSFWSARKFVGKGMLDIASVDLTEEQRYLMMWSNIYDNIRESPDSPDESIMEDDDMLDGWMIQQKRERESQRAKKKGDEITNPKIRNADEVYLVADTANDAKKIDKMNDNVARNIKAQRLAHLKIQGQVSEMNMPDTWAKFQGEIARLESERLKRQ